MTNPPEDPPTKSSSGLAKFWTSLPGVLTGIAAVVAAVVSLIALFHHDPGPQSSAPVSATNPPAVLVTTPAPSTPASSTPASSTPAGSTSAGGVDPAVIVHGSLTMGVDEHADLAAQVVSDSGSANRHDPQFFLSDTDGYRLVTDSARALAVVDGSADRAACLAQVTSRQIGELQLSGAIRGKTICVLTGDQHIAALSPTSLPAVGSPVFAFDYVLWA